MGAHVTPRHVDSYVAELKERVSSVMVYEVEIAAIGFAGHKFLRQSQHHLDEIFIGVYGNYAIKLLRLQLDMGGKSWNGCSAMVLSSGLGRGGKG